MNHAPDPSPLESALRRFGESSTAFLGLYPEFKLFSTRVPGYPEAVHIPYVENRRTWVASGEPLGPRSARLEALKAFEKAARQAGRAALILPCTREFSDECAGAGFQVSQIGVEPLFDLDRYQPDPGHFHSAHQLHSRGARVRALRFQEIDPSLRAACDQLIRQWLETRWMAPFGFLSTVLPWEQGQHKLYFVLEHDRRPLALLAAIPAWSGNGWYLADLLRAPSTPAGSSELLILEAMRFLKNAGASWVSQGVSPLAGASSLQALSRHGDFLFRFRSLAEFKKKFGPTREEPVYLLSRGPLLRPGNLLGLVRAFVPGGLPEVLRASLRAGILRFRAGMQVRDFVREDFLIREPSPRFSQNLARIPFSWGLTVLASAWLVFPEHALGHTGWLPFLLLPSALLELWIGSRFVALVVILGAVAAHAAGPGDYSVAIAAFATLGALLQVATRWLNGVFLLALLALLTDWRFGPGHMALGLVAAWLGALALKRYLARPTVVMASPSTRPSDWAGATTPSR